MGLEFIGCLLSIIGGIWIFFSAKKILIEIKTILQSYFNNPFTRYGTKGSYAIVTGASSGIGKSFCYQLASYGFNICLIGIEPEKMQEISKDLETKYKTKTKIILANFLNSLNEGFYEGIKSEIGDIEIAILVNNAGVGDLSYITEPELKDFKDTILVNCFPIVFMTSLLIPKLLNREKKSLIINLASISADCFSPYHPVYSSSKVFDKFFSQSIEYQLRGRMDIYTLKPSLVTTQLLDFMENPMTISSDACAEGCLNRVGLESIGHGHWKHRLQGQFVTYFPGIFQSFASSMAIEALEEDKKKNKKSD